MPNLRNRSTVYDEGLINRTPTVANGRPLSEQEVHHVGSPTHRVNHPYRRHTIVHDRNEDNTRGLVTGILLASMVGAIALISFFIGQHNPAPEAVINEPELNEPVVVPPTTNTQVQERVIERTQVVPVPQNNPQSEYRILAPATRTPDETTQEATPETTTPRSTDAPALQNQVPQTQTTVPQGGSQLAQPELNSTPGQQPQ